ncbi:MAG: feruloyl-CoA synthase [Planctomycetota bacterium]
MPRLAAPAIEHEERAGGGCLLWSRDPLAQGPAQLGAWLRRWAGERPEATFLAEREGDGWRRLSWRDALDHAQRLGQALVERGASLERPVMILSGNGIEHGLLTLAGFLVGAPVVPVSVAYSLRSHDHARLRALTALLTPGLVFAAEGEPYAAALEAVLEASRAGEGDAAEGGAAEVVTLSPAPGLGATPFAELLAGAPGDAFRDAAAAVGPDTVAKILLTSGSTGTPKGVLNTHRMLCANQQALAQVWPFVEEAPPVLVDWLPWSHTFGGNHDLNLVLRNGGTLYVDDGRPQAGAAFAPTLRNLREVQPTIQFNVPVGYALLVQALEDDPSLARAFFERVQAVFYAAAALPQDAWARLDAAAEGAIGERVWLTTAWGCTETSPLVTSAHFSSESAGNIGVPVPGCELLLAPVEGKLELRVRGPNVTPGYHRDPERSAAAFDAEGFYRTGDAATLIDPAQPPRGVSFSGRVAEDFKLRSGTWVHVGALRTAVLSAAGGLLSAAVVLGQDQERPALAAWLDPGEAARVLEVAGEDAQEDLPALLRSAALHAALRARLQAYNAEQGGSRQVVRVLLLADPPSLDAGELTDKGYVNVGRVLERRPDLLARAYAQQPAADVVVVDP